MKRKKVVKINGIRIIKKEEDKPKKVKKEKSVTKNKKSVKSIVKVFKKEKIPSGISIFDDISGGGFNEESINLIVGGAGAGKTIFSLQFLINGMKKGEICLYITFEEKKEELYRNMLSFGWDLESYEKQGKFIFVEYTPEKVKQMLEEGGGALESLMYKKKISRLVIDSVTSFTLLFEGELAKREAALALFEMTRRWKTTVLLTLEKELTTTDMTSGSGSAIEFEADSIVLLYFIRQDGGRQRLIEILKMRGTKHSTNIYPFYITPKGVDISSKPMKKIKIS